MIKFYRGDNEGNKVIPENLVAVCELWGEIHLNKPMVKPITVGCLDGCDWLCHTFIEVNFSKLMDSNQIVSNDFV